MKRLLLAIACVPLLTSCSEPGPLEPNPDQVGRVEFEGYVRSALDGSAVVGVHVGLYTRADDTVYSYPGFAPRSAVTDSSGFYKLDSISHYKGICDGSMEVFIQSRCQWLPPSDVLMCSKEDWRDSEPIRVPHCVPGVHANDIDVLPR